MYAQSGLMGYLRFKVRVINRTNLMLRPLAKHHYDQNDSTILHFKRQGYPLSSSAEFRLNSQGKTAANRTCQDGHKMALVQIRCSKC